MPDVQIIHTLSIKKGQKIFHAQSCLYSNQINHLPPGEETGVRCAFVHIAELGHAGVYSRDQLMAVRFFPKEWTAAFSNASISEDTITNLVAQHLISLRQKKIRLIGSQQEAFRWVHGDADGIPGIVIDDYGDVVVIQSGSHAGDFLLPLVIPALLEACSKAVFERSTGQIRSLEKLPERTRWLRQPISNPDKPADIVQTQLSGLTLRFKPERCQKTGLFLDQRMNLGIFQSLARDLSIKSMIDLCSYAGAWSCAGALSGVTNFTIVDQDKNALEMAKENIANNFHGANPIQIESLHEDLFEALSKMSKVTKSCVDAVVADPPAFTKSAKHIPEAKRAYQRLTKLASQLVNQGGLYVACSCSRHIAEDDFYDIVSGSLCPDDWIYLGRGRQSPDHTALAADRHSLYLKVLFFMRRGTLPQVGYYRQGRNS